MDKSDFNIMRRDTVFKGYFQVDRYRLQHRLFDGTMGSELTREILERGHVAAVLPYDPRRDEVVLIEQFRAGAVAAGWDPWLIECVAGIIEPGESAEQVVIREAVEESGAQLSDLIPIHEFLITPGASSETVSLFCGRTDSKNIDGTHGVETEGEDIRAFAIPREESLKMLRRGRVVNAITIVALQWLAQNHQQIRRTWA